MDQNESELESSVEEDDNVDDSDSEGDFGYERSNSTDVGLPMGKHFSQLFG